MDFKQKYFTIWQEVWALHKEYAFIRENDSAAWSAFWSEVNSLEEKYADTKEKSFVQNLIVAVAGEIEHQSKTN